MTEEFNDVEETWERDLRRALAELPQEPAPRSLQRKLAKIPRSQGSRRWWAWRPAWVAILLAVPLALVIAVQHQRLQQQEQVLAQQAQEVAQARRELALALSYLEKANDIAERQIAEALESGLTKPVKDSTSYSVQKTLEITREYQL